MINIESHGIKISSHVFPIMYLIIRRIVVYQASITNEWQILLGKYVLTDEKKPSPKCTLKHLNEVLMCLYPLRGVLCVVLGTEHKDWTIQARTLPLSYSPSSLVLLRHYVTV